MKPSKHGKMRRAQKEYPTPEKLGKTKRQHWDIAVINNPPEPWEKGAKSYDRFKLLAAIEFGLNATKEHFLEDIRRLSDKACQEKIEALFVVHLVRTSPAKTRISGRDWGLKSKIVKYANETLNHPDLDVKITKDLQGLKCKIDNGTIDIFNKNRKEGKMEIFYAKYDYCNAEQRGVWKNGKKLK